MISQRPVVIALVAGTAAGLAVGLGLMVDRIDKLDAGMVRIEARLVAMGRDQTPRSGPTAPAVTAAPTGLRAEVASLVRDVLREELAQRERVGGANDATQAPQAQEQPPPSAAQIQAEETAQELVARAMHVGFWGDEQRDELRRLSSRMTREQHENVLQILLPALNRGEIKSDGPPL